MEGLEEMSIENVECRDLGMYLWGRGELTRRCEPRVQLQFDVMMFE
jgi:hypothetical protein